MHPVRATASITPKTMNVNEFVEVCLPVTTKIIKDTTIHMIEVFQKDYHYFFFISLLIITDY